MKPHLICAPVPLVEGGSYFGLCLQPVEQAHLLEFYDLESGTKPVLSNLQGVCPRCLKAEAPGFGFIYMALDGKAWAAKEMKRGGE